MESVDIYEKANEELAKIRKSISTDTTVIDWTRLDGNTKLELVEAIDNVVSKRQSEIQKVILGVQ